MLVSSATMASVSGALSKSMRYTIKNSPYSYRGQCRYQLSNFARSYGKSEAKSIFNVS
ncbi:Uncharacterised protein [Mycobacteroides abscessus subsp. massiliense]|nr:Uncharacterised protein [Mycobacteroides abscessus subsp. massiliense]